MQVAGPRSTSPTGRATMPGPSGQGSAEFSESEYRGRGLDDFDGEELRVVLFVAEVRALPDLL
jgi:hypothetical protein